MELLYINKIFGNGQEMTSCRAIKKQTNAPKKQLSEADHQKEVNRTRCAKRYSRGIERAMTVEMDKFFTLTVPEGSPLRDEPRALIRLVKQYLNTQGVQYFAQLQTYRVSNEYHVHGLCDGNINLEEWIELTDAVPEDCYVEDIYSNQLCAARYILRDCNNLPKGLRASAYNFKPKKAKSRIQVIDNETGEILSDTAYGHIEQNNLRNFHIGWCL